MNPATTKNEQPFHDHRPTPSEQIAQGEQITHKQAHKRKISSQTLYPELYQALRTMNVVLPADVIEALHHARAVEAEVGRVKEQRDTQDLLKPAFLPSNPGCFVLDSILENAQLAQEQSLPVCQDTGFVLVFIQQGYNLEIIDEPLVPMIHRAIEDAYRDGYFRRSVVADPLENRQNTGTNLPPGVYFDWVEGDGLSISCLSKGFGSENYSRTYMLKPTQGPEAIVEKVVEVMNLAGGNCCPPVILGIGIGGTMDWAAKLSKQALLRDLKNHHPNPYYANLEHQILQRVNGLGLGAGGLGGKITALGVHIETYPTHIAGLPVAISVNCWAERKAILSW